MEHNNGSDEEMDEAAGPAAVTIATLPAAAKAMLPVEECVSVYFCAGSFSTRSQFKMLLPSKQLAEVCRDAVSVDKELSASIVHREITVEEEKLVL